MQVTLSQVHALAAQLPPSAVKRMETAPAYGLHRESITQNPKFLVEDVKHLRKAHGMESTVSDDVEKKHYAKI